MRPRRGRCLSAEAPTVNIRAREAAQALPRLSARPLSRRRGAPRRLAGPAAAAQRRTRDSAVLAWGHTRAPIQAHTSPHTVVASSTTGALPSLYGGTHEPPSYYVVLSPAASAQFR